MSDQAEKLRQIVSATIKPANPVTPVRVQDASPAPAELSGRPHSLLFTSGKGGVGTSNLVLNLAIALGDLGQRVVVVDGDIGLANLDLLGGVTPRYDFGDVLLGRCRLSHAVVPGPCGIQMVPGAHANRTRLQDLGEAAARLAHDLGDLGADFDYVLIDAGSGIGPAAAVLAAHADQVIIVSTPEPTSLADAHAAICRFHQSDNPPRLRVVLNQVASSSEAVEVLDGIVNSSRQFSGAVVSPLGPGFVWLDSHVPTAVRARRPFVTAFPNAVASRGVRRIARAILREQNPPIRAQHQGFRAALAARWRLSLSVGD
jgi:flagellar biosynthesis protein FlhG